MRESKKFKSGGITAKSEAEMFADLAKLAEKASNRMLKFQKAFEKAVSKVDLKAKKPLVSKEVVEAAKNSVGGQKSDGVAKMTDEQITTEFKFEVGNEVWSLERGLDEIKERYEPEGLLYLKKSGGGFRVDGKSCKFDTQRTLFHKWEIKELQDESGQFCGFKQLRPIAKDGAGKPVFENDTAHWYNRIYDSLLSSCAKGIKQCEFMEDKFTSPAFIEKADLDAWIVEYEKPKEVRKALPDWVKLSFRFPVTSKESKMVMGMDFVNNRLISYYKEGLKITQVNGHYEAVDVELLQIEASDIEPGDWIMIGHYNVALLVLEYFTEDGHVDVLEVRSDNKIQEATYRKQPDVQIYKIVPKND